MLIEGGYSTPGFTFIKIILARRAGAGTWRSGPAHRLRLSAVCEGQLIPMRDHQVGRRLAGYRARWSGLSLLSKILLVLSLIASLAVVVIILFFFYLFIGGFAGGNNPTSVNALLFPIAFLFLGLVGFPAVVLCGLLWAGYAISVRRRQRSGGGAEGGGSVS